MRIVSLVVFLLSIHLVHAQTFQFTNTSHIDVVGIAEQEVIPNQIKIQVNLKERMSGKEKITLDQLQKDFDQALMQVDISNENVGLYNATSNFVKPSRKKKGNVLGTKIYLVSLNDFGNTISFIDLLKVKNIQFKIREKTHSNIENIKSALKLEALKKAKVNAEVLLKEVGAKKGKILAIQNFVDEFNDYNYSRGDGYLNDESDFGFRTASAGATENFSQIKLKARIQVSFEIVEVE